MNGLRAVIVQELKADHPQTLRGLFYRLVSRGAVEKTEAEYKGTVGRLVTDMRRAGELPYGWVVDQTRMVRRPITFGGPEEALRRTAELYRRSLWDDADTIPEIWSEKDAITGVLVQETIPWDVGLFPCKGYGSVSFLHAAAETIFDRFRQDRRTVIYYLGDHDPSGVDMDRHIMEGIGCSLRSLADWPELSEKEAFEEMADFVRVAVTPGQIKTLNLQTRPTKRNARDYRAKKFVGDSVEVDAIPARTLRSIVRTCIEYHVDQDALEQLRTVEVEERKGLLAIADALNGNGNEQ
jgi:hypothetical protein